MTSNSIFPSMDDLEAAYDAALASGTAFPELAVLETTFVNSALKNLHDPATAFKARAMRDMGQTLFRLMEHAAKTDDGHGAVRLESLPRVCEMATAFVTAMGKQFLLRAEKAEMERAVLIESRVWDENLHNLFEEIPGFLQLWYRITAREEQRRPDGNDHDGGNGDGSIMGIRIHRVLGFGLTYEDFLKLTTLTGEDKLEALSEVLPWKLKSLKPPKEILDRTWTVHPRKDLVSDTKHSANDLYNIAMDCDETNFVLFFPNTYFGERWYRYGDILDYTEATMDPKTGLCKDDFDMETTCLRMKYNPYPLTNFLMDQEGNEVPWPTSSPLQSKKYAHLRAGVPKEIQWYTEELGVFGPRGWLALESMLCTYWC